MGPFQGQNQINKEIVNLIYIWGVNLSVVHCKKKQKETLFWCKIAFIALQLSFKSLTGKDKLSYIGLKQF